MINPIRIENRHVRSHTSLAVAMSSLLPQIQRLLELSTFITNQIRGRIELEARS